MLKIITVLMGTALKRGDTPTQMSVTLLYLLETHFSNCVTVLIELITHHCVTVLPPIYKAVQTQLTDSVQEGSDV